MSKYTQKSLLDEFGFKYHDTEAAAKRVAELAVQKINALHDALTEAEKHLEFCGYGDSYERDCARSSGLPEKITKALEHDVRVRKEK